MSNSELVQIGRVIKPHGVRGELSVEATTDDPELRFAVGKALVGVQGNKRRDLTIKSVRPHKGRLLITFEEIPDRTVAESMRGVRFLAEPLIDDEDDAFYDHELVGLSVLDCGAVDAQTANARAYEGELPEPTDIGTVSSIIRNPSQRLLVVSLEDGGEAYVPFVHEIVPIVDLENEAIVITPPEGLLEL